MNYDIFKDLIIENKSKIVLLVMDGLGGLPQTPHGKTELATAKTPNLDKLASISSLGLMDPIAPGITPGSGPAHLSLFGYDPVAGNVGRGVLSALGIDFDIKHGDLCARVNFATIDKDEIVQDRRAGRISTKLNEELCEKLRKNITVPAEYKLFIETEKEHRAALILRGKGLNDSISETDPQKTGLKLLWPQALKPEAKKTQEILTDILKQTKELLKDQPKANMVMLRGFAQHEQYPTIKEKFKLKSIAIAGYPMYRGLAKLVGMDVPAPPQNHEETVAQLKENFDKYDFFFVHIKKTDSYGEDGNFDEKVKVIEKTDSIIPKILELNPDVLVVTCDHSTPAVLKAHSWHPIPVLLYSQYCRQDNLNKFDELNCGRGSLGRQPSMNLMPLMLANALRMNKYGA